MQGPGFFFRPKTNFLKWPNITPTYHQVSIGGILVMFAIGNAHWGPFWGPSECKMTNIWTFQGANTQSRVTKPNFLKLYYIIFGHITHWKWSPYLFVFGLNKASILTDTDFWFGGTVGKKIKKCVADACRKRRYFRDPSVFRPSEPPSKLHFDPDSQFKFIPLFHTYPMVKYPKIVLNRLMGT